MIHGGIFAAMATVVGIATFSTAAVADQPSVPGEYIVKLKQNAQVMSLQSMSQELGVEVLRKVSEQSGAFVVAAPSIQSSESVVQMLTQNAVVEYAEPNYIYTLNATPNDPLLDQLWGLHNVGQSIEDQAGVAGVDVDALRAWDIQTGSDEIVVAVIDTGVLYDHPDLVRNMWVNEAEMNGQPGVDDDGNGYADDIFGYDFANNDADPRDGHGHGSHCSGTIGASGNDGEGLVGVAWNVKIMGLKFLTDRGSGTLEGAISSIDYATNAGVDIMSNSWGGGGYSASLKEAIERANDAGILFVAAAGNNRGNNDTRPMYPASYEVDNVLSVAAIDNRGALASFSNYGRNSVHLGAPGVDILSITVDGYQSWSGTSMATPHVSGVAALLISEEPGMTPAAMIDRMVTTARPIASLANRVVSGGIVNAYHALTNTRPPADPNDPSNWETQEMAISTAHPYSDNMNESWDIEVPNAQRIAIYFSRFETEQTYDTVEFIDSNGNVVDTWSGNHDQSYGPVIEGNKVTLRFKSDSSITGHGFDIEAVAFE